jgi:hypothetical protein
VRTGLRLLALGLSAAVVAYGAIAFTIWQRAEALLVAGSPRPADAALVPQLVMSGGIDHEDGRIESEVMAVHARAIGYTGPLLRESQSNSTRENLAMSAAVLREAGVRRVIVVSEPYHLWRVERLARASGFAHDFDVQYAAAPTACWQRWGMRFRGALREPLAIVNNAFHGYF